MKTFTLEEIASDPTTLASVISLDGGLCLRAPDGNEYLVRRAVRKRATPLRIEGIHLDPPMTREEIVALVRDAREGKP